MQKILSAIFKSREAYEQLLPVLDLQDFNERSRLIVEKLIDYYNNDKEAKSADTSFISSYFSRAYPKHGELFSAIINNIEDVSVPNIVKEYKELKLQQTGLALSESLMASDKSQINRFLEKYISLQETEDTDETVYVSPSPEDFASNLDRKNMVRLYPKSLNIAVGDGVPRGTHIVVFARPEAGKSMFAINLTHGFLKHGEKVLYIGNEDPAPHMIMRIYTRLTGMSRDDILNNKELAKTKAAEGNIGNLVFASPSPGSTQETEVLIKKHQPTILVIDQFTNFQCKVEGEVEKSLYLAKRIRQLVKKYNLVGVSVCQAGDSATNKLVLGLGDVYYSNTGIPAQADIMIGVGSNEQFEKANRRMISLPKNKISGNHEPFPVIVEPATSKVLSI